MKKLLFLAAFVLLGNIVVSCEDVHNKDSKEQFLASDDILLPIKPPTKP